MKNLLKLLENSTDFQKKPPLTPKDAILAQKDLTQAGLSILPDEFMSLLKIHNGLRSEDGTVLGIHLRDDLLDIVTFNKHHNASLHRIILGYDTFNYLVFDSQQRKYLLIDRTDGFQTDEFLSDEIESAFCSILHI
ncbi:MAG: hypothetical protein J5896_05405 [Alphaproteobacteria bacterium]|nr:hypothetical protein [Alphaproteobacteria bacterium]